jgi:hypothetical protein
LVRIGLMVSSRWSMAPTIRSAIRPLRESAGHALEGKARGEEPLNDGAVQVRGDPLALLEHRRALLLGARLGKLDRERRLIGESGSHPQVLL